MDPTAAPVELIIDGKTYKAYPLRDVDHEELNKWVRRKYMECCQESVGDDKALMAIALSEIQTMNWLQEPGKSIAFTVAGLHKLTSIMCRTLNVPYAPFKEIETQANVVKTFRELHPIKEGEDGEGEPGELEGN